jgi:hypothetical protein
MYIPMVIALMLIALMLIALMLIFQMASTMLEAFIRPHDMFEIAIAGKWFVFWAVGMRLFIAGLRQIFQPRYTADTILGVKDPDAMLIVRELGFANTAIGSAGLGSLFVAAWRARSCSRPGLRGFLRKAGN